MSSESEQKLKELKQELNKLSSVEKKIACKFYLHLLQWPEEFNKSSKSTKTPVDKSS